MPTALRVRLMTPARLRSSQNKMAGLRLIDLWSAVNIEMAVEPGLAFGDAGIVVGSQTPLREL